MYLPLDRSERSLSAAAAVVAMLEGDPSTRKEDPQVPLFRDPATGRELTYAFASSELRRLLEAAGEIALAHSLHSPRRGGATAVANHAEGGHLVSGFMGTWASAAQDGHLFAMRRRVERAASAIAAPQTDAGPLAVRPGSLVAYAGRSR